MWQYPVVQAVARCSLKRGIEQAVARCSLSIAIEQAVARCSLKRGIEQVVARCSLNRVIERPVAHCFQNFPWSTVCFFAKCCKHVCSLSNGLEPIAVRALKVGSRLALNVQGLHPVIDMDSE